jgi:CheY-like chemotaxis protein
MLTLLVVDDEFAVLEVLAMALEGEGYRVLKAGDGNEALRMLATQPCDIVISDDLMPMMTGSQLIEAMRGDARYATIPVVLMVDVFGRRPPPPAPAPGVHVLAKPLTLAKLFALVEELAPRKGRT